MGENFSSLPDDIAADILSRLPPKHLLAFKCASKCWCRFVSGPEFAHVYALKTLSSDYPIGIFTQETTYCREARSMCDKVQYACMDKMAPSDNLLSFLPERTTLVSSSNGIVCCRSLITSFRNVVLNTLHPFIEQYEYDLLLRPQVFYICNPATREWFTLSPPLGFNHGRKLAIYFDPHDPSLVVVGIQQSQNNPNWCFFVICNSRSKIWRKSREYNLFAFKDIRQGRHVFLNGRCYWLTRTHHVVIFDVKTESCQVINAPHISLLTDQYLRHCCLGISNGHVQYTCAYTYEITTWMLKDDHGEVPQWIPSLTPLPTTELLRKLAKYSESWLVECYYREKENPGYTTHPCLLPIYLYNNVLFLIYQAKVFCYNLKSGDIHFMGFLLLDDEGTVLLPYCGTLFSLKLLDGSPTELHNPSVPTKRRTKRRTFASKKRRKPILPSKNFLYYKA